MASLRIRFCWKTLLTIAAVGAGLCLRAVAEGYPLRGRLKVADVPFGPARPTDAIPAPGQAWADSRLLARLGASVGSTLAVGAAKFKVTRVLDYRPDQGAGFADLSTTLLVNVADIELYDPRILECGFHTFQIDQNVLFSRAGGEDLCG